MRLAIYGDLAGSPAGERSKSNRVRRGDIAPRDEPQMIDPAFAGNTDPLRESTNGTFRAVDDDDILAVPSRNLECLKSRTGDVRVTALNTVHGNQKIGSGHRDPDLIIAIGALHQ